MSFWSKIGLADAMTLAKLQEELCVLRSENSRLHNALSEQLVHQHGEITETIEQSSEIISKGLATIIEQGKISYAGINETLRNQGEFQKEFATFKTDDIDQIRELLVDTQKSLDTLREEETAREESVRSLNALSQKKQETMEQMLTAIAKMSEDGFEITQKRAAEMHEAICALSERSKDIYKLSSDSSTSLNDMSESTQKFQGEILEAIQCIASYREEQDKRIGDMEKYLCALWEATKLVWINDLIEDSELDANG